MNRDQAQGKWDQLKGRAKKAWGELTDDDFKKAEGSEWSASTTFSHQRQLHLPS